MKKLLNLIFNSLGGEFLLFGVFVVFFGFAFFFKFLLEYFNIPDPNGLFFIIPAGVFTILIAIFLATWYVKKHKS